MRPHDDYVSSLLATNRLQLEFMLTCSRNENQQLTAKLHPRVRPLLDVNDAAMPSRKKGRDMTVEELVTEIMNIYHENEQLDIVIRRVEAQSCGVIRSDVY